MLSQYDKQIQYHPLNINPANLNLKSLCSLIAVILELVINILFFYYLLLYYLLILLLLAIIRLLYY